MSDSSSVSLAADLASEDSAASTLQLAHVCTPPKVLPLLVLPSAAPQLLTGSPLLQRARQDGKGNKQQRSSSALPLSARLVSQLCAGRLHAFMHRDGLSAWVLVHETPVALHVLPGVRSGMRSCRRFLPARSCGLQTSPWAATTVGSRVYACLPA